MSPILVPIHGLRAAGSAAPQPLATQSVPVKSVVISGVAGFTANGAPINNGATAYVGLHPDRLPLELLAGKEVSLEAPEGCLIDLKDVWVSVPDATPANGRGVAYFALALPRGAQP